MAGSDHIFYDGFERDGEDAVRHNLALGRYGEERRRLAQEWIRRKEATRADASNSEQIEIARSAKEAAWEAARAANIANTIAKAALVIAIIAAITAIGALFVGHP